MTFLRLPKVIESVGLSRSTIYAMVAGNTFPKPIKIGHRAVAWNSDDIRDWMSSRREVENGGGY